MFAKLRLKVFAAGFLLASTPWVSLRAQELPASAQTTTSAPSAGVCTGEALPCTADTAEKTTWWARWKAKCRSKCDACEAAQEAPVTALGETVAAPARVQIANGVAARMVLYNCDFVENSDRLSVRGRDELARISMWALHHPCPIIIERTPYCPGLDEARRKTVVQALAAGPISAERVIVAPAIANGLGGRDPEIMWQRMNAHTQGGGILSGGGGGSQSFGPSGFGVGAAVGASR